MHFDPGIVALYSAPLWLPLAGLLVYVLIALTNLCINGLLFLLETYLGVAFRPHVLFRIVLALPALVLYPVAITLEMGYFFLVYLGSVPLERLGSGGAMHVSTPVKALIGALFPLWAIPGFVLLVVRFYRFTIQLFADLFHRSGADLVREGTGTFESFVGLRYLKARKNQSFISAITLFSILGVMVGVCALVVVLSVMSGFEEDLKRKILGTNSHAVVLRYGGDIDDYETVMKEALEVEGVKAATPFIYSEVMLSSESTGSGVILKGIDPATVGAVTDLVESIREGLRGPVLNDDEKQKILDTVDAPMTGLHGGPAFPGIIVGEELAHSLRLFTGDIVTVVSPVGDIGPMGMRTPRMRRFMVAGIFRSGMYEYDAKFTYISLKAAQDFFAKGDAVTGIELKVDDIYRAREIAADVQSALGYPYWTRDWMSMNKNLFSALYLEKIVMGVILGMIIVVAALNIISTLIMVVIEKGKEIAILKAMGANGVQIMKVFMIEGLIIGFIGTTLGLALGFFICYILDQTQLIKLNPDVYYLDTLPVEISGSMFALVALAALAVSFIATLYPSWQAARQDPVEGLRYE